ncbi:MAG: hypothetical protein QF780_01010 [Candidatus Marinimicrobia bacterium]|jgi:hypothetical protein|nr:hypothetical protein [Candidatus Neomarinimicrobiota bacterium]|tara:strand:- start:1741 stop:1980 length:240 start_codon:yes stop_codon:yes gene_type:complete
MKNTGDLSMDNDQEELDQDNMGEADGGQAYQTLVDWVKTVPGAIDDIKKNGTEEDLRRYKEKVKMVVDKLKEIEKKLSG